MARFLLKTMFKLGALSLLVASTDFLSATEPGQNLLPSGSSTYAAVAKRSCGTPKSFCIVCRESHSDDAVIKCPQKDCKIALCRGCSSDAAATGIKCAHHPAVWLVPKPAGLVAPEIHPFKVINDMHQNDIALYVAQLQVIKTDEVNELTAEEYSYLDNLRDELRFYDQFLTSIPDQTRPHINMGDHLVALRQEISHQEIYDFLRQKLTAYRDQVKRFGLKDDPFYQIHLHFLPPPAAHHRRPRGGGHPKI